MIVSDVLKKVLKNLSREDVLQTNLFLENGTQISQEQQELVDDLIECLNDAVESVAYVYSPLKTQEEILVCNKKLEFSNLLRTIIDVVSLEDKNGILHNFSVFPSYLECENGEFVLTYTYLPDAVCALNDEIEVQQGKITTRILASGCTARFFVKRGMFQEANVWDTSFQRLLLVGARPKHLPVLPIRGWF